MAAPLPGTTPTPQGLTHPEPEKAETTGKSKKRRNNQKNKSKSKQQNDKQKKARVLQRKGSKPETDHQNQKKNKKRKKRVKQHRKPRPMRRMLEVATNPSGGPFSFCCFSLFVWFFFLCLNLSRGSGQASKHLTPVFGFICLPLKSEKQSKVRLCKCNFSSVGSQDLNCKVSSNKSQGKSNFSTWVSKF